jgi:hypothetical protein
MIDNVFSYPETLDARKSFLQRLLVYDASAGTYQSKTGEASSTDSADIFHSTSGALISAIGDSVFFGVDKPFHYLRLLLSTIGSGGEVVWKYWDGQSWKAFTPTSGIWHFTSTEKYLLLWPDYSSIPPDWQKKTIDDYDLYWISASVTSAFSTSPIGSQITAVSNLQALLLQV